MALLWKDIGPRHFDGAPGTDHPVFPLATVAYFDPHDREPCFRQFAPSQWDENGIPDDAPTVLFDTAAMAVVPWPELSPPSAAELHAAAVARAEREVVFAHDAITRAAAIGASATARLAEAEATLAALRASAPEGGGP